MVVGYRWEFVEPTTLNAVVAAKSASNWLQKESRDVMKHLMIQIVEVFY